MRGSNYRAVSLAVLALCMVVGAARGDASSDAQSPSLVSVLKTVESKPSAERVLGALRLVDGAMEDQPAIDEAKLIATVAPGDAQAVALHEWLCWRAMPVGYAGRERFRKQVESLNAAAPSGSDWGKVFELYLAVLDRDRDAMLRHAGDVRPRSFPSIAADRAAFELLTASDVARNQAGLLVISGRRFDSLHGLEDLDRTLSKEAAFLQSIGREGDATKVEACRDALRSAWLEASRHTVERLFALQLAGKTSERDALIAKRYAFEQQLEKLGGLGAVASRVEPAERYEKLIEPMLAGDLAILKNPPLWLRESAGDLATTVRIEAKSSRVAGNRTTYQGEVVATFGDVRITCNEAEVTRLEVDEKPAMLFSGSGGVTLRTVITTATADRVNFTSTPASFQISGDVVVRSAGKTARLTSASLTFTGAIARSRSLLDDWREAKDLDARLALAAKLSAWNDAEFPDDAKYLVALKLIEPHLSWHAPHPTPRRDKDRLDHVVHEIQRLRQATITDNPWGPALGREKWMTIPQGVVDEAAAAVKQSHAVAQPDRPREREETKPEDLCYWRLKEPKGAAAARAVALLRSIKDPQFVQRAAQWAAEIERNNTVITFDVAGGYPAGREGPVVVDVRNADKLEFKLYRVNGPDDLLAAADHIGRDYIFRDYGLQFADGIPDFIAATEKLADRDEAKRRRPLLVPQFREADLIHSWAANVADLPWLGFDRESGSWRHDRWSDFDDDDDEWYFGDANTEHQERLNKEYRPSRRAVSSWRTDRVVKIPAKGLEKPGAYVLVATANGGVSAVAPVIVEPLSLTLRRSRDGVFVMTADASGRFPVVGADVTAIDALRPERTDRRGAAFLRVHAAGDKAIVVHKDGRYAIGGFGRVFDGVYRGWLDQPEERWLLRQGKEKLKRAHEETLAQVYDDRTIVAAYTDRPTYRPGQQVQLKLIVRQQAPAAANDAAQKLGFRAEDFDLSSSLTLPKTNGPVIWEVIDPRGRVVESGESKLSDFGTAIGEAALSAEAPVGRYSLRVTVHGMARVVPDVFAVKYYRRPNFQIKVEGVPTVLTKPQVLSVQCVATYYFGTPVTEGALEAKLVRADQWRPLSEATVKIGPDGRAVIELDMPKHLEAGQYAVICTLTDASGRSVSAVSPIDYRGGVQVAGASNLPALPRFVAVGQELTVRTDSRDVIATVAANGANPAEVDQVFLAKDGAATIRLSKAGWHRLQSGGDRVDVFAYATGDSAIASLPPWESDARAEGWVNLTDPQLQEQTGQDRLDDPSRHLYALFERHHAVVGDKLRLLVYCPLNQARILLTIEGRTVIDYLDITTTAKAGQFHVVEIPIKPHYGPNFYVQGRVLAGAETAERPRGEQKREQSGDAPQEDPSEDGSSDPRWCRVDVIDPNRKPGGEKLSVRVEPERTDYKPGEEVAVRIGVTGLDGKPREAEVSLAVVDESVFSFGEDSLGSLASVFGQTWVDRRFQAKTWRSSTGAKWSREVVERARANPQAVLQQMKAVQEAMALKSSDAARASRSAPLDLSETVRALPISAIDGKLPVTSIALAELRRDFRETAAWHPKLRTNAEGMARTTFTLPHSLTSFRLSAVGLTRGTEIGVGRAAIKASLPLSVQLFLPRFAVEKDRHEAVALVHNHGAKARRCALRMEIDGAAADGAGWKVAVAQSAFERELSIEPGASVRAVMPLNFTASGSATVRCRVADLDAPNESDSEEVVMPVSPLGRPVEHVFNGAFRGEHRIQLPAGVELSELKVTLSRNDVPNALSGLGYLVEYPYGCVEQTMSRFLPAVMVEHAVRRSAVELPSDVMEKLPHVLAKGLERLYAFQHDDGGFGWFGQTGDDRRDDAMTLYVMYGLARCKALGVPVDETVLARGCAHLKHRVGSGALQSSDAARAWFVLALAGKASGKEVRAAGHAVLKAAVDSSASHESALNLALACREAGEMETARRLWNLAKAWEPTTVPALALKLLGQSAFGDSVGDCYKTADAILAHRQGHRWAHTRDTSWALEALAELVHYAPPKGRPAKMTVAIGDRVLFETDEKSGARDAVEVRIKGSDLAPAFRLAPTIVLRCGGDDAIHFAVSAAGVEKLEQAQPKGDVIKVSRQFETLDAAPLAGPIAKSQVIAVRLTVDLAAEQRYVIIEDRRPGGLEFADDQLRVAAAAGGERKPASKEFRDDRLCVFFDRLPAGRHTLVYYLRAESAGISHILPACAYPMYDDKVRGETGTQQLEVAVGHVAQAGVITPNLHVVRPGSLTR